MRAAPRKSDGAATGNKDPGYDERRALNMIKGAEHFGDNENGNSQKGHRSY